MLRDEAVVRIQDGLGFRPDLATKIVARLKEAQRELEAGKTLPRFLRQQDQTLTLLEGTSSVALPAGFIREEYDEPIRYTPAGTLSTRYMMKDTLRRIIRVYHDEAVENANVEPLQPEPPKYYMIRKSTVDFFVTADQDYDLLWTYYASGASLDTNVENEWLANAPEWLIGEAGSRMAMDLRDAGAITLFQDMAKKGRASAFGEIIAGEEAGGPHYLGEGVV